MAGLIDKHPQYMKGPWTFENKVTIRGQAKTKGGLALNKKHITAAAVDLDGSEDVVLVELTSGVNCAVGLPKISPNLDGKPITLKKFNSVTGKVVVTPASGDSIEGTKGTAGTEASAMASAGDFQTWCAHDDASGGTWSLVGQDIT